MIADMNKRIFFAFSPIFRNHPPPLCDINMPHARGVYVAITCARNMQMWSISTTMYLKRLR